MNTPPIIHLAAPRTHATLCGLPVTRRQHATRHDLAGAWVSCPLCEAASILSDSRLGTWTQPDLQEAAS
ncbi:hypothetical protein [Bifidobacterium leontopitheci]|uniref:Uncharacterized protein n=1 Tax=Bifidobacterium leontopitheci TaxID=2650774 RepID=A0A6I1GVS6_9BIFI|nr:hypothetical protein [Bifidobacterium leontopitheci]KAB7790561.1 hypothetical protein F7D09_0930 [Bifidobacterium leontopitheci]